MDGNRGGRNKRRGRGYGGGGTPRGSPRGRGGGNGNSSEPNSPARNENEQQQQQQAAASPPVLVQNPESTPEPVQQQVVETPVVSTSTKATVSSDPPGQETESESVKASPTMPLSQAPTASTSTLSSDQDTRSPTASISSEGATPTGKSQRPSETTVSSPDQEFLTPVSSPIDLTKNPVKQPVDSDSGTSSPDKKQEPEPEHEPVIEKESKEPEFVIAPEFQSPAPGERKSSESATPAKEPEPEPEPVVESAPEPVPEPEPVPIPEPEQEQEQEKTPVSVPEPKAEQVEDLESPAISSAEDGKLKTKTPPKIPSRKNSPVATSQEQAAVAAAAVAAAAAQLQQERQQGSGDDKVDGSSGSPAKAAVQANKGEDTPVPVSVPEPVTVPVPPLSRNSSGSGGLSGGGGGGGGGSGAQGKLGYLGGVASSGGGGGAPGGGGVDGYSADESLVSASVPSAKCQTSGWMGFNRRQLLTLLVFSLADFFSAIIISLQAPFYPAEAEGKGATATEFGLVFGVFELVVFLTSPIYGKYLHKVGPKLVFNAGILTTGVATILFGFLDRFDDHITFIALSFVIRTIEALGSAAFVTASFAIIAQEFPDSVATTFASLETFFGLGLIVGPTLGGAMYDKGGFILPFVVMGSLLFAVALVTFLVMPNSKQSDESDDDSGKESPGGILSILKIPAVLLAAFSIVTGAITIGFLNSTLEPHIRQFTLTPVLTGLVFIINGGMYAVTAPAWGWICDKTKQPRYVALIGAIIVFFGFLFIGPAPFLPMDTVLWLTCVGLVIHGVGLGATLVSAFIMALRESINHGYADNIQTYGLTSALWTSSFALGSFIGPSIGGVLLDHVGFRLATLFVLGAQVVLTILILAYLIKKGGRESQNQGYYRKNRTSSESAPLLGPNDPCSSKTMLALDREKERTSSGGYGATSRN